MKRSHNLAAEQAVLGAILAHNEALLHCPDLRASHFYAVQNARIFEAVVAGWTEGRVVTPVTLKSLLDEGSGLTNAYLASLVAAAPIAGPREYAKLVVDCAMRRELQAAAERVLYAPEDAETCDLIAAMAEAVDGATRQNLSAKLHTGLEVRGAIAEELKAEPKVFSTGLKRLDNAMQGGLHQRRLYGVAADSGHGKTLLACTISNNLKNAGHRHLFICAEMGENETHARSLAKDMGVDVRAFSDKSKRNDGFWKRLGELPADTDRTVVYYSDSFLTFDSLKQVVATAVARYRITGFILDYWQLVGGKASRESDASFLGEVAQWQAAACKRYGIWGFNTAQLNRDGVVLGSGGLQRAVDQMYFLHRPDETEPYAWLEMKKTRYTRFMHVGDENDLSLKINETGGFFECLPESHALYSAA